MDAFGDCAKDAPIELIATNAIATELRKQTCHIIAPESKCQLKFSNEFSSGSMATQPKGNLSEKAADLLFIGNSRVED